MTRTLYTAVFGALLFLTSAGAAGDEVTVRMRLLGLFGPERAADLRAIVAEWGGCQIVRLDFDHAEAELRFDPAKLLPGTRPADYVARLDDKLRHASRHTLGAKPLTATPRDRLRRVTIPVAGLDCKACCLAAYEIVARIDGVEQATASFRDGLVTALIDPARTDRSKLEAALKERGVAIRAR